MKKIIWIVLFVISANEIWSQSRDSVKFQDPTNIPDTQRTPPNPPQKGDTIDNKLQGGALIDTVTQPDRKGYRRMSKDTSKTDIVPRDSTKKK